MAGLEITARAEYVRRVRNESRTDMAMTNPLQFIQQVRSEVAKVVWPTRREVMLTTVMVFILAALTAIFFAIVDILIRGGLQQVLEMFG
ncbi:protein translocase subunit secE/sec61 gamma [Primorskyibacter flagellatus]|uniref:Protein translocase subunit SecE n=2 Tax=Primorskyibacter flagellatus TaxID=1387277 RepID=A0A1W2AZZ8_9RHOB|nr:protein translocase subunit secE/sec61 gamma [Primorskyibacter flagellatus]